MAATAPPRLRSSRAGDLAAFAFAVRYLATARATGAPFATVWGWLLARVDVDDAEALRWSSAAWQRAYDREPAGRMERAAQALLEALDVDE